MGLTYEDEEGERRGEGRGGMAFEKVLVKGTNSQIKLQVGWRIRMLLEIFGQLGHVLILTAPPVR